MRHDRSLRLWAVVLLAVGLGTTGACEESLTEAPVDAPDGVARLVAVSSTDVVTSVETFTPTPLRVRVLGSDGRPVQSAVVRYELIQGSGFFSSDSTLTNDQGFTEVTFTPAAVGTHRIEARVERMETTDTVVFTIVVPEDLTVPAALLEIRGDGQAATIGDVLPEPFVVQVLDRAGDPVADHPVTFTIEQTQGDGAVIGASSGAGSSRQIVVLTDAGGLARAFLTLGDEVGIHTVTASAVVTENGQTETGTVTFTAAAEPSFDVEELVPLAGQTQTVIIDTLHERDDPDFRGRDPNPFVLQAVDEFGNRVAGVTVQWRVSDGGGTLAAFVTTTDDDGITQNVLRDPSAGSNVAVAFTPGADPVEFTVTGEILEPEEEDMEDGGGG